jgi:hypothetical protein
MSVGSVGKWLALGVVVAALGTGCDDGGDDETGGKDAGKDAGGGGSDAGAKDAGGGGSDAGPMDAGGGADTAVANSCPSSPGENNACCTVDGKADTLCTFHTTGLGPTKAGCAVSEKDAAVCGLSSMNVLGGKEPLFIEKDAPGVDSPSCTAFYDNLEAADAGTKGNGVIDTFRDLGGFKISLQYPGCCTAAGHCSIDGKRGKASTSGLAGPFNEANTGYGCMKSAFSFGAYAAVDAGAINLSAVPCDPATGMIKLPSAGDAGAGDAGATDANAGGG